MAEQAILIGTYGVYQRLNPVRFGPKGQQVHGLADTVQYTNIKYEAVLKKEIKNKRN